MRYDIDLFCILLKFGRTLFYKSFESLIVVFFLRDQVVTLKNLRDLRFVFSNIINSKV